MDINDLRGLATLLAFSAFVGICLWAYSRRNTQRFDEAAHLPFADEPESKQGHETALKSGEMKP